MNLKYLKIAMAWILATGTAWAAPEPATGPTTQPGITFTPGNERAQRVRFAELIRKSIACVRLKQFGEAERALKESLEVDPGNPTSYYNLACVYALTGRPDDAMEHLTKAAGAGFTDFRHIEKDSDLDSLRGRKDYAFLLAHRDDFARKAAQMALVNLKREFGEGYLYEIDNDNKLIFATHTDSETLKALKRSLTAQARSQWKTLFAHKPDQFIVVVVPSEAMFRKIVPMRMVEGFYNHSIRTLIAKGLGFVTTHEFTHALHAADADFLGQEHPIWMVEGLAVLYEHSEWAADKPGDEKLLTPMVSFRLQPLKNMVASGSFIPLSRLLTMNQEAFVRQAIGAYAEAGNLMVYLNEKKLLRTFYETYKANYDRDRTGQFALEEVTGMKLPKLEEDFKQWIRQQQAPSVASGKDGAFLGLMFGSASEGIHIKYVRPDGPAGKAGLKIGDLIVGLNDVDVRDMPTFLPMLAAHRPGDTVTLKIRRDRTYMDVAVQLGRRAEAMADNGELLKQGTKSR